jgi:hypothetical protein
MRRPPSSQAITKARNIISAHLAVRRNSMPIRQSMHDNPGWIIRAISHIPLIFSFFSRFSENVDIEQSIPFSPLLVWPAQRAHGERMSFFIISPELYAWVILPMLIFFARICDVSMETIRVIYISRGIKFSLP